MNKEFKPNMIKKFLKGRKMPMRIKTNEELTRDIDELKNENWGIKKMLKHIAERVGLLEIKADRADKNIIELRGSIVALSEKTDKRFDDMQDQMDRRFNDMQNHMDRRFDSMQDEINGMQCEIHGIKDDMSGMKDEMGGMKSDMSEMKTDMSEMKTDMSETKNDMRELKCEMREMKEIMKEMIKWKKNQEKRELFKDIIKF